MVIVFASGISGVSAAMFTRDFQVKVRLSANASISHAEVGSSQAAEDVFNGYRSSGVLFHVGEWNIWATFFD